MIEKAGLPIKVSLTTDRRLALKGADFVTTQMRIGSIDARILDEKIPLKYDVIGQETNGQGGLFKGLRTIPVILDICRDMEELCPNAWLINFTNPAGMVTEAVLRYSKIKKAVGLCNVAKVLNVESARIHIDFAGLNHMVFGLRVYLDGKEKTAEIIDKLTAEDQQMSMQNIASLEWEPQFLKALQVIPCPYHRYYYKTREMLKHEKEEAAVKGCRGEVVKQLEKDLLNFIKTQICRSSRRSWKNAEECITVMPPAA